MFTGFTDETIQFFLDLKFHNNTTFFHEQHDRYVRDVQTPFYAFIEELAPTMLEIDPGMEVRPHKCLSRIHRDTRFSRDKSPYRDHHWLLFRRAAEPREKSINYFFEFGPDRLNWGMGIWGENREVTDLLRKRMAAHPDSMLKMIRKMHMPERGLIFGGTTFKRIEIPAGIPETLKMLYSVRELYILKREAVYASAFSDAVIREVKSDFQAMAPLYRLLRGYADEVNSTERKEESKA